MRTLVLAHRDELIEQAADKIRMVIGDDADVGIVKAARNEVDADIVVASVQTLARPNRLALLDPTFGLVIVDEAHHAEAPSYQDILTYVRAGAPDGPLLLGVTATADLADGRGLDTAFDALVHETQMLDLIRRGHLADLIGKQVAIAANFNSLHTRAGDIIESEAGELLLAAKAPQQIARAYRKHAADRKGLAFAPTVKVAHAIAEALNDEGIAAVGLDGATPRDERRAILNDLKSGAVQVVSNCAVLTEGYDEPSISCITNARPTKSRGLYVQMVGRGTRPYPGKANCLILDLVGSASRHDLMSAASLFGLPAEALKTKSVAEAIAAKEAEDAAPTAGRMVAADVDLFRTRPAQWVPTGTGRFVLPTGQGTLVLRPAFGGRWDVMHVPRQGDRETLMTSLSLEYATGFAEDWAKSMGAGALVDRNAPWRNAPPTEKQLRLLLRLGVPFSAVRTKGEASDAITAAFVAEVV